jgi:hypothetical protein
MKSHGFVPSVVLVAYVALAIPAKAQAPVFVAIPNEIVCDGKIDAKANVDNKGVITIGDGKITKFACGLSKARLKPIALKSPAVKSGVFATQDFGSIKVSGAMVEDQKIFPPIRAEYHFSMESDKVEPLKAFLAK